MAAADRSAPPRGRQRLRLRRQQFPLRPRGSRPGQAGSRLGRRRADPRFLGRSARRARAAAPGSLEGLARLGRNPQRGLRAAARPSGSTEAGGCCSSRGAARPTGAALSPRPEQRLESCRESDGPGRHPPRDPPGSRANDRRLLRSRPRPGQLALLFPGQGSQYVGMLRDLACRFPRMQQSLALSNEFAGKPGGPALEIESIPGPLSASTSGVSRSRPCARPSRSTGDRGRQPGPAGDP